MMNTRTWWGIIVGLFAVITAAMIVFLVMPAPSHTRAPSTATTTPMKPTPSQHTGDPAAPMSSNVVVTSPESGAHVGHSFTVAGMAPGPWFFEAQFPVMVRAADGHVIGRATARAQGEWMTEKQVTFTTSIQLDITYHGAAKLVLLKDNPSGLPENDDSVEIPITVD